VVVSGSTQLPTELEGYFHWRALGLLQRYRKVFCSVNSNGPMFPCVCCLASGAITGSGWLCQWVPRLPQDGRSLFHGRLMLWEQRFHRYEERRILLCELKWAYVSMRVPLLVIF
jgi:hypothetical protein